MKRTPLFSMLALIGSLGVAGDASAQTTIYADNFDNGFDVLNGTAPDVAPGAETWTAGDFFYQDGFVASFTSGGADGVAAFLPLTTEPGIYNASTTITNAGPDWIAFGFMPALPPDVAGEPGDWTVQDFSVRHSNSGAYAWMLGRTNAGNDNEAFNGVNTDNNAFGGDIADVSGGVDYAIVLDTRSRIWTAEYFIDGASQGVFDLPGTANVEIGGIGYSRERDGSGTLVNGQINDFELTLDSSWIPGDTNDDGAVSNIDLQTAISNFTGPQEDPEVHFKGYFEGDTDGNGAVSNADLQTAISNFTGPPAAAVPEPASLALLSLGGLLVARRRRA